MPTNNHRTATALTIAGSTLALFGITSLFLHTILSRTSDLDDSLGPFFERHLLAASSTGQDDPLASGSATRKSRTKKRRRRGDGGGGTAGRRRPGGGGGNGAGGGAAAADRDKRRMDGSVDLDEAYPKIRAAHDAAFPTGGPDHIVRLQSFARSIRAHDYQPVDGTMPYDVNDCPSTPPENYPVAWPVLDVLANWNPDDTDDPHSHRVYQGLCRFDATTEYEKALAYRQAEVPFVIRDDPVILPTVERWNQPGYLTSILGKERMYRTDFAKTNQLMFYRTTTLADVPANWEEPTTVVDLSYPEWLQKANNPNSAELNADRPHWYFRLNAKDPKRDGYLYDEMPFFQPDNPNFYMVDPTDARGINCRFGMRGNTAENHFDSSRNFIALFGGERRYFLSHPDQCRHLCLYPMDHPSARHSEVNWSDPDLNRFPQFRQAKVNEVVLQAGDVLYLPTSWFHHIVSLDTNYQCNARSGITSHYAKAISDCGFRGAQTVSRRHQRQK